MIVIMTPKQIAISANFYENQCEMPPKFMIIERVPHKPLIKESLPLWIGIRREKLIN
jgi:hypothetical protein